MVHGKFWLAIAMLAALGILFVVFSANAGSTPQISGRAVGENQDRINEGQIELSESAVMIRIPDASLGRFEDSGSMGPFIGKTANALLISPSSESDIMAGDIIAYHSAYTDGLVSHRVVKTSSDDEGWYALAKGDSASSSDPGKIRFGQIKYVVVGILY